MSWSLEFAITGDEEVALELRGLALRAGDAAPAFAVLEQTMEENEARWFRTRGSGTWPPLKDETKKRKRREGLPSAPLYGKSLRLSESLAGHTSDSVRFIGPDVLVFGTSVEYARFHRYGTARMAERNPLTRSAFVEADAREVLSGWLLGPVGKRYTRTHGGRKQGWWR